MYWILYLKSLLYIILKFYWQNFMHCEKEPNLNYSTIILEFPTVFFSLIKPLKVLQAVQFILLHTSICNRLFPVDCPWKERQQRLTVLTAVLKNKTVPYHK